MGISEQKEIWRAAYNAALTGALASGKYGDDASVRSACLRHAEHALVDLQDRWKSSEGKQIPIRGT